MAFKVPQGKAVTATFKKLLQTYSYKDFDNTELFFSIYSNVL